MNMGIKIPLFSIMLIGISLMSAALKGEQNKICLTMIVKNEERIIERCLDSVKDIVDCIVICDTGSTDNTVSIVEDYIKKSGIPGQVYQHEWKNFGHNRSLSFEAAKATLQNFGFSLANSHLLLIDADMQLLIEPQFNKESLQHDSYTVTQKTDSLSFSNTRLIRASLPWRCIGVTHEYWSCLEPCSESKLDSLNIDDKNDGGCKADKFERDIRLLTNGLQQEPENERYLFYLALSYRCLDKFEEAIDWFNKRIEKGGWNEEIWYSKYMIGECYEAMDDWEKALAYYLEAFQFNPDRAEPLQKISRHYCSIGKNDLAYLFAKQGTTISYPSHQLLFISHPVYDYLLDEDLSVAAFYTAFKEDGYAATNRLLLKKGLPYHVKEKAYENLLFYIQKLPNTAYKSIAIDLPPIQEGFSAHYNPMNPSILKTGKGYQLICRTVNYTQIGAKHFKSMNVADPTIRTRNFLVQYDRDFNLLSQQEIIETLPREKRRDCPVQGLEDCRLFEFENSLWFTCTTRDTNPTATPQVSLCKLSAKKSASNVSIEKFIPMQGPDPSRCEKNWLPFVKDGEFHLIYSYDPFVVCKPNIHDKRAGWSLPIRNEEVMHDFSRFSGSASPIKFDQGYLAMIHEVIDRSERTYIHRFVYLDAAFNITKVSKPFTFLHQGIEYCCGMTQDHSGQKLVITVGIEDREAYLAFIDIATVRSLLEPLPEP